MHKAERYDEAIDWYRQAAEAGDAAVLQRMVELMETTGRKEEAIDWLRSCANTGETEALPQVAGMLDRAGRHEVSATPENWLTIGGSKVTHSVIF